MPEQHVASALLTSSAPAGGLTALGVGFANRSAGALLYGGPPATPWGMNPVKGQFTEAMMHKTLVHGFLDGTHWASVTPARSGNHGIDGLFFRTDSNGHIRSMLVVESKFGTSRLGQTLSGKQMSQGWTKPHLEATARNYSKLATTLHAQGALRTVQPPPRNAEVTHLPCKNGKSIQVWEDHGRLVFRSSDPSIRTDDLLRQAKQTTQYIDGASRGRIDYRSRLFTTSVKNNQLTITFKELDPVSGNSVGPVRQVRITPDVSKSMSKSVESALRKHGYDPSDARTISEKVMKDPEFINEMNRQPRMNPRAGLQWQNFAAAGLAGLVSFLVSSFLQGWHGQKITWTRNAGPALLTSAGTLLGGWVGTQLSTAIRITALGQKLLTMMPLRAMGALRVAGAIGGVAGGLVATAMASYLLAAFGLVDWKTAHRSMVAGGIGTLAGAGATFGVFSAVSCWGVASTGTAISTLSGAAATNATLAAIGLGGGMAAGSAILTGGAAVIIIAVGIGVGQIFKYIDKREKKHLLLGRLGLVSERVAAGVQLEWAQV